MSRRTSGGRRFPDTNVLAYTDDEDSPEKRRRFERREVVNPFA